MLNKKIWIAIDLSFIIGIFVVSAIVLYVKQGAANQWTALYPLLLEPLFLYDLKKDVGSFFLGE